LTNKIKKFIDSKKYIPFVIFICFAAYIFFAIKVNILIAISLPVLILLSYFVYRIYISKEVKHAEDISIDVSTVQVDNSIKVLRYAVASLSVISWITTAEGLRMFVFQVYWQAFVTSFAVQSILLIFNLMFINFYFKIKKIPGFTERFKYLLTYLMAIFYIITLSVSTSFSYVYIANSSKS